MPGKSPDLNGSAPDTCSVALLVIDALNDLDYPGAEQLRPRAIAVAERIAELADEARKADVPVVFVNDNLGLWRSSREQLLDHLARTPGAPLAAMLTPRPEDYFVLKPRNSGFFATPLQLLLQHLEARTLVLTGLTTESCIVATAYDAHVREFRLMIPEDAVAALDPALGPKALAMLASALKADVRPSTAWRFDALTRRT